MRLVSIVMEPPAMPAILVPHGESPTRSAANPIRGIAAATTVTSQVKASLNALPLPGVMLPAPS